jgi:4'-phosphopantetheinyl transferase EntD
MKPRYRELRGGEESTELGALLPAGIVAVEALGDVVPDPLLAGEALTHAIEARRLEHARGRSCVRRAMAMLGVAPSPVPSGPDRAPIWPPGIIGSITHCQDYACAVLGRAEHWSSVGIDAERLQTLPPESESDILLDTERAQLVRADPAIAWPCVVFSIKEAFYKAVYPQLRRILEFHDVEVRLDPSGRFEARLVTPDHRIPSVIEGRFHIGRERVLSVVVR